MAAAAILFAGLVTAGQTAMRAGFDTQEMMSEAWNNQNDWVEETTMTDMTITNVNPQGGNTRVRATNTGETVIDGAKVSILADGIDRTSTISTRKVASKTTDVWAPAQEIEIIITGTGYSRVVLVEEHGSMEVYP